MTVNLQLFARRWEISAGRQDLFSGRQSYALSGLSFLNTLVAIMSSPMAFSVDCTGVCEELSAHHQFGVLWWPSSCVDLLPILVGRVEVLLILVGVCRSVTHFGRPVKTGYTLGYLEYILGTLWVHMWVLWYIQDTSSVHPGLSWSL